MPANSPADLGRPAWNEITIKEMVNVVLESFDNDFDVTLFFHGPPAIGKSQGVAQACASRKRIMIDDRLAQKDPTDTRGVLCPSSDGLKARWLTDPRYEPLFDPDSTYVLFGDEFSHSSDLVQKGFFEVALDKALGGRKFGPNTRVILAGNRESDGCNVVPLEKPMHTRVTHFYVRFDFQTFFDYALNAGNFEATVLSYFKERPDKAYKPATSESDYYGEPTPRSWEFVSKAMRTFKNRDLLAKAVAGCVGPGEATEFLSWVETAGTLTPIINAVLAGENKTATTLSRQFFVCQSLVERFRRDDKIAGRLMDYLIAIKKEWAEVGGLCVQSAFNFGAEIMKAKSQYRSLIQAYARTLA